MITKKTIFLLQFIALFYPGYGQNNDYILKRESFREALTILQLSPGGENLLAGFMNGSFGILDARSFEIKLMVDKACLRIAARENPVKIMIQEWSGPKKNGLKLSIGITGNI